MDNTLYHLERVKTVSVITPSKPFLQLMDVLALKAVVIDEMQREQIGFVIDLHRVTDIDAGGLGAVLSLLKVVEKKRNLAVSNCSESIAKKVHYVHLHEYIGLFKTTSEAVNSFQS